MLPEKAPKIVIHRGNVKINNALLGKIFFERQYHRGVFHQARGSFIFNLDGEKYTFDTSVFNYSAEANKYIRTGLAEHGEAFLNILADKINAEHQAYRDAKAAKLAKNNAPRIIVHIEPAVAPKLNVEIEPAVEPKAAPKLYVETIKEALGEFRLGNLTTLRDNMIIDGDKIKLDMNHYFYDKNTGSEFSYYPETKAGDTEIMQSFGEIKKNGFVCGSTCCAIGYAALHWRIGELNVKARENTISFLSYSEHNFIPSGYDVFEYSGGMIELELWDYIFSCMNTDDVNDLIRRLTRVIIGDVDGIVTDLYGKK